MANIKLKIPFNFDGSLEDGPLEGPLNISEVVSQVLRSGKIVGNGEWCKTSCEILEESGYSNVLLTPSCTGALEMMALLLDVQPGDEIILPSYTFTSTANAFALRGAKLRFCDVELETFNLDPKLAEGLISPKTKAVLTIHYGGVAGNIDKLQRLSQESKIYLLEDSAQCIGASYKGKNLGCWGELGALSFHQTKNIHCGEGGALLVNNPDWLEKAHLLQEKGTNRTDFLQGKADKYQWMSLGSSYVLSDLLAAVLAVQLQQLNSITDLRRQIWFKYHEVLSEFHKLGHILIPSLPADVTINGHIFPVVFKSKKNRNSFIESMQKAGIGVSTHYIPLHSTIMGKKFSSPESTNMKNTDLLAEGLVRLPIYPEMQKDQEFISEKIDSFFRSTFR